MNKYLLLTSVFMMLHVEITSAATICYKKNNGDIHCYTLSGGLTVPQPRIGTGPKIGGGGCGGSSHCGGNNYENIISPRIEEFRKKLKNKYNYSSGVEIYQKDNSGNFIKK